MAAQKRSHYEEQANNFLICADCKNPGIDFVLMASCGCIFCSSCFKHGQETCSSCLLFLTEGYVKILTTRPCKYHERCSNQAQFLCKCVLDGQVCASCLTDLHTKRVSTICAAEKIQFSMAKKESICHDCSGFISEYHVPDENKNVCFECKVKYKKLQKLAQESSEPDTEKFLSDFALTKRIINCKKQKVISILKQRENIIKEEADKIEKAIETIKSNFSIYQETVERENEIYKKHEETLTKKCPH